jgi:hypothetical protein
MPRQSTLNMKVGQRLTLAILSINCANPALSAQVVARGANSTASLSLRDDGRSVDQVAGDGIFSGVWTATQPGTVQLSFPGNDIVTVRVK